MTGLKVAAAEFCAFKETNIKTVHLGKGVKEEEFLKHLGSGPWVLHL